MVKISYFSNLIYQHFSLSNKNISLYDDKGIQISEDADLLRIIEKKILFFTKKGEEFDNNNLLRMFIFKTKLGEGGFGKVYYVEQKCSGEKYAIKFLRHSFKNVHDVQFLYKEIEVLIRLENPNIIKLYSYFETQDNKIGLIMEYASGGTLKNFITEKGKLSEQETSNIIFEILNTIGYCHKMGIIHHDLKTDNILFENEEHKNIKIIDFGICSLLKKKSKAGSLQYLAPEILSGRDTRSLPSVDIWSIGCIIYEMLTGKVLFDGKKREDIKKKILSKNIKIPETISLEAASLIIEMLRMRPSDRISVNDALNHAFFTKRKLTESEILHCQKYLEKDEHKKNSNSFNQTSQKRNFRKTFIIKIQNNNLNSITNSTISYHNITNLSTNHQSLANSPRLTSTLPNLITKVSTDFTEEKMFQYNLHMMTKFKGEVPNFLKPIGFSKEQKHNFDKMAWSMNKSKGKESLLNSKMKAKKKEFIIKLKIVDTQPNNNKQYLIEKFLSPSPQKPKKIVLPCLDSSKSAKLGKKKNIFSITNLQKD